MDRVTVDPRNASAETVALHRRRANAGARPSTLRYGFNEINGWWHMSLGPHASDIRRYYSLMGTEVIRVFVFDQPVPNPISDWRMFSAQIDAVLAAGARPMITFAKFEKPHDNDFNVRRFVERCRDVVWGCVEQWGGERVKDWYWCVWNEPNNLIIGGDLTFDKYRVIYEEVAHAVLAEIGPFLDGRKAMIGGPSIDGTHRSYWMDWIGRLLDEVEDGMIGFVNWHRYGDWRPAVPSASLELEMWGSPDAPRGRAFETLLMAQTPSYEARARGVARLIAGRDVLNVCGELNTISHHENYYTLGLNQNAFGAAYYASALIHLIRGGADLEMRWTGTGHADAYGLISMHADLTTAGLGKLLFTQHVRRGDLVSFPALRPGSNDLDVIVASNTAGRLSAVIVNTGHFPVVLDPCAWDGDLATCSGVLRIDASTGGRIVRERFDGQLKLGEHGIAVVTTAAEATVIE